MRASMVAYTFYEFDNRVRRYAETLVRHGHQVDVVALRSRGQDKRSELYGVRIYRIQERTGKEKGKGDYLFRLLKFLLLSGNTLSRLHARRPYDLVHVHSVPDFEVFASLIPRLTGAKLILDIHDIVPEFYASKFGVGKDSPMFKGLVWMERLSIALAHHVIVANDIWRERLLGRSVKPSKCTTILNYPDPRIFAPRKRTRKNEAFVFLYPGTVNWHQGLDIAVRAFARIAERIPRAVFHIYGGGPGLSSLERLIQSLGLEDRVLVRRPVPMEEVARLMAEADVGVVPKRNDDFGGEAFSTKILEFMCMGTPVIVSRTRIDAYYFDDSVVKFFRPEDEEDLARAMQALAQSPALRKRLSENGLRFAQGMTWDKTEAIYLNLVHRLIHGSASRPSQGD